MGRFVILGLTTSKIHKNYNFYQKNYNSTWVSSAKQAHSCEKYELLLELAVT